MDRCGSMLTAEASRRRAARLLAARDEGPADFAYIGGRGAGRKCERRLAPGPGLGARLRCLVAQPEVLAAPGGAHRSVWKAPADADELDAKSRSSSATHTAPPQSVTSMSVPEIVQKLRAAMSRDGRQVPTLIVAVSLTTVSERGVSQ